MAGSADERKIYRGVKAMSKKSGRAVFVDKEGPVPFEEILERCKLGQRPKAERSERGKKSVKDWGDWAAAEPGAQPYEDCVRVGTLTASKLVTNGRGRVVSLAKSKNGKTKPLPEAWSENVFRAAAAPSGGAADYEASALSETSDATSAVADTETDVTPRDYVPPGVRRDVSDSGEASSTPGSAWSSDAGSLYGSEDFGSDDYDDDDDFDDDDEPPKKAVAKPKKAVVEPVAKPKKAVVEPVAKPKKSAAAATSPKKAVSEVASPRSKK